ncbi:thioredoxin family protein [Legionella dresdenensis]|uniref:Thioredoxin family protein n=1 Tax=Legionella dresdenensis TaxID=450200 RepID=A0ABV8CG31_9GAMM
MAKTPSTMISLGTEAPDFCLSDVVTGKTVSLSKKNTYKSTVIMFICNHCPYVKHVIDQLPKLAADYSDKGVNFIAISSNDVENYPEDSPEKMKLLAESHGFGFPYLFDSSQEVAKAYHAACTPDFFIYDSELRLAYRGQLDDSRPGNAIPVTGDSIRQALDALLSGQAVSSDQKPSIGCNIKWKE